MIEASAVVAQVMDVAHGPSVLINADIKIQLSVTYFNFSDCI